MPGLDDLGNVIGGAAGTAAGGPLLGGVGAAVGGWIGGLFGGGGVGYGTTEFDGLHSPTLPRLEASTLKTPECGIYAQYARGFRISVEEVELIFLEDMRLGGHSKAYVLDAYRAYNLPAMRGSLNSHNLRNPGLRIIEGEMGPRPSASTPTLPVPAPTGAVQPLASTNPLSSFTAIGGWPPPTTLPVPGNTAAAAGPTTLADWAKLLLNGAKAGAIGAALDTPAGMEAKNEGFKSFLKDNQLIIAGVILAIAGAFAWALNRTPRR